MGFICIDDQQSVAMTMVAAGVHELIGRLCRDGGRSAALLTIHLTYKAQPFGIDLLLHLIVFGPIEVDRSVDNGIK